MLSHWISSAQRKFARKSIASVVHVLGILLTHITQSNQEGKKVNLMPQAAGLDRSTKSRHHKQKDASPENYRPRRVKSLNLMPQAAGLDDQQNPGNTNRKMLDLYFKRLYLDATSQQLAVY